MHTDVQCRFTDHRHHRRWPLTEHCDFTVSANQYFSCHWHRYFSEHRWSLWSSHRCSLKHWHTQWHWYRQSHWLHRHQCSVEHWHPDNVKVFTFCTLTFNYQWKKCSEHQGSAWDGMGRKFFWKYPTGSHGTNRFQKNVIVIKDNAIVFLTDTLLANSNSIFPLIINSQSAKDEYFE